MKLGKPHYGAVNLEGWSLPKTEALIVAAAQEALQCAAEEDVNAFFTTEDGVKLDVCLKLDNGSDDCGPSWKIDIKEVLDFMFDDLSQEEKESITSYFYDLAKWLAAKTIQSETPR